MKTLPFPPKFVELMNGEEIIVHPPKGAGPEVEETLALKIEDSVYFLVGVEPEERELFKRSWCFFLGMHSKFIPVFSLRVAEVFTDQDIQEEELDVPHLADTLELQKHAAKNWDLLKDPRGINIGTVQIAESEVYLETPEGFKKAYKGDLLVYCLRARNFWIVNEFFAKSLGWSLKRREEDTTPELFPAVE